MKTKVSVCVPIYNVEKYIGRCAESLINQTFRNIEIIFVNDCSQDNSITILRKVIDSCKSDLKDNIKIINHDKNRGLAAARNTAIEHAQGEFIMHVDSDDFLPYNSIELLVSKVNATEADIIDGAFENIIGDGDVISTILPFKGYQKDYIKLILSNQGLAYHNVWGKLIRRSLYTNNQISAYEGINFAEDFSVMPRLLLYGKRETIDEIVYCYRNDNANSYMNSPSDNSLKQIVYANEKVYEWFLQHGYYEIYHFDLDFGLLTAFKYALSFNPNLEVKTHLYSKQVKSWILKVYKNMILSDSNSFFTRAICSTIKKIRYLRMTKGKE